MNSLHQKKNLFVIYLFLLPTIVIFILFYLFPIVTVFVTGFTLWDGYNPPSFSLTTCLDNYLKLCTYDGAFFISLRNLAVWSLLASTVHVGFGALVAFIFYRQPWGWKIVRGAFMVPMIISMAAWAIIYRFVFNDDIGILNNAIRALGFENFHIKWFYQSPAAFITITMTWLFYSAYCTLIILADLMAIPRELHESAVLEGAGSWYITRHIHIPLVRNAIGTSIILSITSRIAMFEQIYLTTKGGPGMDTYNIPLMVYEGIVNYEYGYANAASTIMILLGVGVLHVVSSLFRMNETIY